MAGFFVRLAITSVGLWVASTLVSGIRIDDTATLVWGALLLGNGNAVIRPIAVLLTLPITKSSRSLEGYALTENYLFTEESFRDYLDHLTPEGNQAHLGPFGVLGKGGNAIDLLLDILIDPLPVGTFEQLGRHPTNAL